MTTTLQALKTTAQTTITGHDGSPYRTGPEGIVFAPSTESATEITARTGKTVTAATATDLTTAGIKGGVTTITPNTAKDHG